MPSPFPGMNPYLEPPGVWNKIHAHALPLMVERLVPQVVPTYIVLMDEHVYIHDLPNGTRSLLGRADLSMGPGAQGGAHRPAAVAIAAPAQVQLPAIDVVRLTFI